MSDIRGEISEQIKTAMKAGDKTRLDTLRLIKAEVLKRETAPGAGALDQAGLLQLLQTMKKQRLESIDQFTRGKRMDLVGKEQAELAIIESFLPRQMEDQELDALVNRLAAALAASGPKDLGSLMQAVMAEVQGRADGKRVSALVKARLGMG